MHENNFTNRRLTDSLTGYKFNENFNHHHKNFFINTHHSYNSVDCDCCWRSYSSNGCVNHVQNNYGDGNHSHQQQQLFPADSGRWENHRDSYTAYSCVVDGGGSCCCNAHYQGMGGHVDGG